MQWGTILRLQGLKPNVDLMGLFGMTEVMP